MVDVPTQSKGSASRLVDAHHVRYLNALFIIIDLIDVDGVDPSSSDTWGSSEA